MLLFYGYYNMISNYDKTQISQRSHFFFIDFMCVGKTSAKSDSAFSLSSSLIASLVYQIASK